jgi:hypothetical protein
MNAPRIAIYTAVFGKYDPIKRQAPQNAAVDFYCYTDHVEDTPGWTMVHIPSEGDPRHQAKFYKLMPHGLKELEGYDYAIWIDGSMAIRRPDFAAWMIEQIGASGWAMFAHGTLTCIYDEATVMATTKKYKAARIREQAEFYKAQGCPPRAGLYMAGLIARDMNNPAWKPLCDAWWDENNTWTLRDQISLPYVLWKLNGALDTIPGNILLSPHVSVDNDFRKHEYDLAL